MHALAEEWLVPEVYFWTLFRLSVNIMKGLAHGLAQTLKEGLTAEHQKCKPVEITFILQLT